MDGGAIDGLMVERAQWLARRSGLDREGRQRADLKHRRARDVSFVVGVWVGRGGAGFQEGVSLEVGSRESGLLVQLPPGGGGVAWWWFAVVGWLGCVVAARSAGSPSGGEDFYEISVLDALDMTKM
ncbi:hypothetical protein TIFTF001_045898 [Ficus carica]|uniref:Uncharacterized protein n=1 Tax=Ficus carica TaxID=3494 RepID=A0AA88CNQ4_FICCA|nr:hypothetical protein TIFTF001_045898 [Ficus carica]